MDNSTREILSSLSPLVSVPLFPILLLSLATRQKYSPNTKAYAMLEYDYIVVGAGSGGAAIASRLSEEPCVTVLLLEAGGRPSVLTEIPSISPFLIGSYLDWNYLTVPQKNTGGGFVNRQVRWPRGKMFGGTSTLNSFQYVRGNRQDYEDWDAGGAKGWSYDEVLPYFKKSEDNKNTEKVDLEYHGVGGPQTVDRPDYEAEIKRPAFEAFKELGYDDIDINGPKQTGAFDLQATIREGQRCSTAKAYLVPSENRTNLDILGRSHVTKVIIENRRAVGVEYDRNFIRRRVRARREVILSAGAINTPQLLMLSGIGPAEELRKFNIPVIANLPVGKNLQDHVGVLNGYEQRGDIKAYDKKVTDANSVLDYHNNRSGPLASASALSMESFVNPLNFTPTSDVPMFQIYIAEGQSQGIRRIYGFTDEVYDQVYRPYEGKTIAVCMSAILQPRSKGFITLNSTDPYDHPIIQPNYLEDSRDMDDLVEAMKICDVVGKSEPMRKIGYKPFTTLYPGCESLVANQDNYFRCVAGLVASSSYHPVGTAKMGDLNDDTVVVDAELRVKTIEGLRVVDASVMPKIIAGNPSNPVMMIAEKAADMIKKTITCGPMITTPRPNILQRLRQWFE